MEFRHKSFPNTAIEPFEITSPHTRTYNCIAWAANVDDRFFWPDQTGHAFWPNDIPREVTMAAFRSLYEKYGFEECESGDYEKGFLKIAIYAKNGVPTHAARQIDDTYWTSKLGSANDVRHTLNSMSGGEYGDIEIFMRKRLSAFQKRMQKTGTQ